MRTGTLRNGMTAGEQRAHEVVRRTNHRRALDEQQGAVRYRRCRERDARSIDHRALCTVCRRDPRQRRAGHHNALPADGGDPTPFEGHIDDAVMAHEEHHTAPPDRDRADRPAPVPMHGNGHSPEIARLQRTGQGRSPCTSRTEVTCRCCAPRFIPT
ncbi:hypothetical protein MICRO8M_50116 [Microbacterium sp. 8M]|nr:hypothetical protein MICRO8M_50116 [Microbacterium sp. 8M]